MPEAQVDIGDPSPPDDIRLTLDFALAEVRAFAGAEPLLAKLVSGLGNDPAHRAAVIFAARSVAAAATRLSRHFESAAERLEGWP